MRRSPASSANSCRVIPASTTGRPMSEPALRALCCRSMCRRPTPGSARWSSSPRAALPRAIALKAQFETYLKKTFPGTDTFVKLLEVGPPVGRPVQYRLSGPDIAKVREFSQKLAGIVRANPHLDNVVFDWMEPARVVKVDVLQDKARQLGVSFGRHRHDLERRA